MKKFFIISAILLIGSTSIFSQGWRFGIEASPQLSWMKSDKKIVDGDGTRFNLGYGLGIDYFFGKNYAFSTGITINNTGGKQKFKDSVFFNHNDTLLLANDASVSYKLQYLTIPLSLKFTTNEIGYITYYGQLGLTTQIRVKSTADIAANNYGIAAEKNKEDTRLFNVGYHIGAGIQYSLGGNTALVLGLIYNNGFTDVTNIKGCDDKTVINNITLKVGIIF